MMIMDSGEFTVRTMTCNITILHPVGFTCTYHQVQFSEGQEVSVDIRKPRSCLFTFFLLFARFSETYFADVTYFTYLCFFTYPCFVLFASLFSEHITYLDRLPFSACGTATL